MTDISALAAQLSPKARERLMQELIRAGTAVPAEAGIADSAAEPIAVVGVGCRFPGNVTGPESFWELLTNGGDAITEVPADRWDVDAFYDPDPSAPGRMTTRWGGFISDAAEFDAEFFGIAPREAEAMDPQQRVLLEVGWAALEHAGIRPDSLNGTRTGVIAGLSTWDYAIVNIESRAAIDAYLSTGIPHSTAVGRISYSLGLRGPAVAVDTACSSSLVAVHLACQSLRLGETDLALAGGTQLNLSPFTSIALSKWSALSPAGRCKTFDASADGFVRGEGCGVVVLKRLSDAVRDGNRVLAVVRGSAVNQDGRSNGITAPNALAQRDVITDALKAGGIAADSVNYVEAHGTGTVLGDPIEFEALAATYGRGDVPCAVGAVKTNIGHLEASAGIAGFIKTVLSVQRGHIPPNLHFTRLNPAIDASSTRFVFPTEPTPWPNNGGPRRAGVSSFGLAGTNAHVVVEQAPDVVAVEPQQDPPVSTLVVSGKSEQRIASTAGALAQWMQSDGAGVGLADVAHTLNHHRARHAKFATVCARDRAHAITGLQALADGRPAEGVVRPHEGHCRPGTVFVFPGQGQQWAGMGRQLLADEPVFAEAVAELEPVFVEHVGFSLQQVLSEGQPVSGDARVQPVIMGLQLALTELWRSYGVTPDAVIGHSMGEVTAAVVAGALTVAEGLRVIAIRSQLMSRLAGQGAVALLELDAEATAALIAEHPQVSLAVYSSPRQTVIAGPPADVDALIAAVAAQDRFARRVNMEVASHNALMDPILPELRSALADLAPKTTTIPFISTVAEGPTPVLDADYWAANVRQPVWFSQAVTAAGENHATFIEISAHPNMAHAITETLGQTHHHSVGTLSRDADDTVTFHTNLNTTHTTQPPHTPHPPEPAPVLPATPWHHTRHWITVEPANEREPVVRVVDSPHADGGAIPAELNYELTWPVRRLPPAETMAHGSWLVVADADLGAEVRRAVGGDSRVTVLTPGEIDLAAAVAEVDNVMYAPGVPANPLDAREGYRLFNAARRLTAALGTMAVPPRLVMLTRNAQPLSEGDRANPAHAVLWGLGRTLALEHPEIWGAVVDVDESVPAERAARYVLTEANSGDDEDQVVYRGGVRHVPRLVRRNTPSTAPAEIDKDSCHLVVGATGNIGPYLIQQLSDMGAATIVAVSRQPGSRLEELARTLSAQGTSLITVAADAADEGSMAPLFERFGTDLPPLGGIYLAAFGGGPVTLADMTDDDVNVMFRPKLDALSVLHRLSVRQPVRQFVLFSSISGLLGSRWLAHYAATTTFLDTFAYARRAAGLSASTVNWGFWKSLADNQSEDYRQVTIDSGLDPMQDEVAIQALSSVMAPEAPIRFTVVAADWSRLGTAYRTRASLRMIDELVTIDGSDDGVADGDEWAALEGIGDPDPIEAERIITDRLLSRLAAIMGYTDPSALGPDQPLIELGMDSLMAVRIRNATQQDFGVEPPVALLLDGASLNDIAANVMSQLGLARQDITVDAVRNKANQRAAARQGASMRRQRGLRT
jgi:phthiocerol/phenolphthiocerol synthesis type-I polyketide synthase B